MKKVFYYEFFKRTIFVPSQILSDPLYICFTFLIDYSYLKNVRVWLRVVTKDT